MAALYDNINIGGTIWRFYNLDGACASAKTHKKIIDILLPVLSFDALDLVDIA